MCQSLGTGACTAPPSALIARPFNSQNIDLPAVMTPENVVVAVAVEVAGALNVPVSGNWSVRHAAFGFDRQAIHLPEIDLPAVVAPENAALAVVVEVAKRRGKVHRRAGARVE